MFNSEMISNEFRRRTKNSLKNIVSPKQDLTFSQLKIYYEEKGFIINRNFLKQLDLYTNDGKYNYNAYLLADNNTISIRFGKYEGTNAVNLIAKIDMVLNDKKLYHSSSKQSKRTISRLNRWWQNK